MINYTIQEIQPENHNATHSFGFNYSYLKDRPIQQIKFDNYSLPYNRFYRLSRGINNFAKTKICLLPEEIKRNILSTSFLNKKLVAVDQFSENKELANYLTSVSKTVVKDNLEIKVFQYKTIFCDNFFNTDPFQNIDDVPFVGQYYDINFKTPYASFNIKALDYNSFYCLSKTKKMEGVGLFLFKRASSLCNELPNSNIQWSYLRHPRPLEAYMINDLLTDPRLGLERYGHELKRLKRLDRLETYL